ncbi:MAG: alpha-N-arabinofuranosidase [Chloroflexi bacterium]|nr:alpha-N-arabinofuranosidase [Chloroflexota bacterium]MBT4074012.1 alpha-N-arabinofuranosidase [Chloroflexota bacterium]MBT4514464.1 alpha-N-arabinofuranosidase [Chloroflexota bacterium]
MPNSRITLDPDRTTGKIDNRIFSGFLEHLGRAIYDGVYDPGNPLSDDQGFRRDVLDAMRPLRMPFVRYPGGNFVSNYDWKDGVGPKDSRPVRADFAWQTSEPNTFGTDEFMDWCKTVGTDPMMAVNLGTGTAKSASELVEYCNHPSGTYWSDLRRTNGHSDPHDVKLWCLGNEMDGPWQAGHVPASEYALRAEQAGKLMKGVDPSIETIIAGSSGNHMPEYMEWDRVALEYTWDHVDYISAHRYSRNENDDTPWFLAEGVEIDRIIEDYRSLLGYVRAVKKSSKQVYLSFDEWNVWYRARGGSHSKGGWAQAPHLIEEVYNLEDALVVAQYLNSFIRNADVVKIACLAQIVNVIAPVLTNSDGLLFQSIYHPIVRYAELATGDSLTPVIDGPEYDAGERGSVPSLDVSASYESSTGEVAVFAVNRDPGNSTTATVSVNGRSVTNADPGWLMTGDDPKAFNDWAAADRVVPSTCTVSVEDGVAHMELPPMSIVVATMGTST